MKFRKFIILIFSLITLISLFCGSISLQKINYNKITFNLHSYQVTKIFDGDTLEVNGDQIIRLQGVDTPEIYKDFKDENLAVNENFWAQKAKQYTESLIRKNNNKIFLKINQTDKYNRLVAIVFFNQNLDYQNSLNNLLVQNGLARVAYIDIKNKASPYYVSSAIETNFANVIKESETIAKQNKLNIFSKPLRYSFHKV
ncbi:thermonuclease family protein [Mycoplasma buteonis]|uniref:thermonuclease family protein n=1 Tax=Mycoplasma buteonis TaxID=171280 RepID=UPI00068C9031|nr:thermonuclease family protein [Mycoplasma buteonis]